MMNRKKDEREKRGREWSVLFTVTNENETSREGDDVAPSDF